ncbi:unnamed protein product [Amoebophrya sp. A120]|nr:unnamed protein product [Amoebophrya sp. A120]|eukprot:GSA120T00021728001.1
MTSEKVVHYRASRAWIEEKFRHDVTIEVDLGTGKVINVVDGTKGDSTSSIPRNKGSAAPAKVIDLPENVLVMPGFVNCHSHAFQRGLRGKGEEGKGDFWTWRQGMHRLVTELEEESFKKHCLRCFLDMRDAGVTSVGEFHYFHHGREKLQAAASSTSSKNSTWAYRYDDLILQAAKEAGIRIVLLSAYYARGGVQQPELNAGQKRFRTTVGKDGSDRGSVQSFLRDQVEGCAVQCEKTQSVGVVAHSIRALTVEDLRELVGYAKRTNRPFHMHMEEQRQEIEQCRAGNGGRTPLRCFLDASPPGDLSYCTLVHCTHSNGPDMAEYMGKRGGNVCVCPLTEGSLADGLPHEITQRPDRVVVGSDSNLRIDLLEEARWLEYGQRVRTEERGHFGVSDLVRVLTTNGARSLGLPVGKIARGHFADFALLDCSVPVLQNALATGEECLAACLFGCSGAEVVAGTVVGGELRARPNSTMPRILQPWILEGVSGGKNYTIGTTSGTSGGALTRDERCDCRWRVDMIEECEPVLEGPQGRGLGKDSSPAGAPQQSQQKTAENLQQILQHPAPDVVDLARALIDIDSVSGTEVPMANALSTWFQAHGYDLDLQSVEPETGKPGGGSRFNVLAWPKGTRVADLPIIFNTHIDVVPPYFPSDLKLDKDGREILTGRGACDTKSLIAAMLLSVQTPILKPHRQKIGFLFVVSEETTHQGMKKANALPLDSLKYLIVGEPTAGKVMRYQKGILKVKIDCEGVAAHSGYPHLGVSATELLLDVLEKVRKTDFPSSKLIGQTDCNIGFLDGGQAINALPERASASLMFRLVSKPEVVWVELEKILSDANQKAGQERVRLTKISENAPVDLTHVDKYLGKSGNWQFGTACFNTDIPYLQTSAKAFLYGHGDICDAHCPREFIGIEDLRNCVTAYAQLASQLLLFEEASAFPPASKLSPDAGGPASKRHRV